MFGSSHSTLSQQPPSIADQNIRILVKNNFHKVCKATPSAGVDKQYVQQCEKSQNIRDFEKRKMKSQLLGQKEKENSFNPLLLQ